MKLLKLLEQQTDENKRKVMVEKFVKDELQKLENSYPSSLKNMTYEIKFIYHDFPIIEVKTNRPLPRKYSKHKTRYALQRTMLNQLEESLQKLIKYYGIRGFNLEVDGFTQKMFEIKY